MKTFWSVGEHCLCCAKEAAARGLSDRMVLACLLHLVNLSIPTLIVFKGGKEAARSVGFTQKEKILAMLG